MSPVSDSNSGRTPVEPVLSKVPGHRPAPPEADPATEIAALAGPPTKIPGWPPVELSRTVSGSWRPAGSPPHGRR